MSRLIVAVSSYPLSSWFRVDGELLLWLSVEEEEEEVVVQPTDGDEEDDDEEEESATLLCRLLGGPSPLLVGSDDT